MPLVFSRKKLWDRLSARAKSVVGRALAIVPPQYLLGKQFRRNLRLVGRAQWWPAERARDYQLRRLRALCKLAYAHSPFYRKRFDAVGFHPGDLKSLEDFAALELIDKTTVRENLADICTCPTDEPGVDEVSTGGTGGMPLRFFINADRSPVEYAYLVASWSRGHYSLRTTLAALRGRVVSRDRTGLYHEFDPILRTHYYSSFHMSDDDIARYLAHIARLGTCMLHVYPSTAAALARHIQDADIPAPTNIRGIIAESETVYPEQRRTAEQVFGCRYFSCYGHSEKLVMAAECEHNHDYHVWPTYGYFELLDADGRAVTTPGQRGEIVGTGFINTVMPFIRYRTADTAEYVADRCAECGREHPIIRDIRSHRTQGVLIAADGSEIVWSAMNMHDDTFINVRQFQFRQDAPGRAVLRVVPSAEFADADRRRILNNLGRKLDDQLTLAIELTDSIPLSPRGKTVYVDQRAEPAADKGKVDGA